MKHKALKVICLSLFASVSIQAASLKDNVEKVLNNNPEIIAEKKNQEAFKKYIDEREAKYLPRLDIDGRLEKSNSDKKYKDQTINKNGSEQEDGYNLGIAINQMLYDGDLTPAQIREAKHNDLSNTYRSNNNIQNIVYETVNAYTGLVQYDEMLNLTKSMIQTNEDNLRIAKEKESISGEILETYETEGKLNFMKEKYIEEQDLKHSRIATFKRFVGEEPAGNECRPKMDLTNIPNNLQDLVEKAVLNNYEIKEQIEKIKAQREKIAQADSKFLPNFSLELKALTDNDLSLNENGRENQAFGRINLAWNLFNGGADKAVSEQETLFLAEQKQRLDAITNKVVEEIKVNFERYQKNKDRINILKNYVVSNENIVEVYKSEFESGTRTFVDILDAQTVLYEAKKSLINREYELYRNYYDILSSLSILTDTVLSPANDGCSNGVALNNLTGEPQNTITANDELRALLGDTPVQQENVVEKPMHHSPTPVAPVKQTAKSEKFASFQEAPAGYYTINITTTEGIDAANGFVRSSGLDSNSTYTYPFGPEMASAKVIYGIFKSVKDANIAMDNLPASVKAQKPYVDNVSKHQKLYDKYHK
ncbi:TolC family protein [Arcobacter vandammei]|uniref:TolC family protein n=1 Tax=Arcobacter vandammei TaxID=2782243 RepID=UPI0018E00AFC|nr:TolC family protein [Arcobacter vandammei]